MFSTIEDTQSKHICAQSSKSMLDLRFSYRIAFPFVKMEKYWAPLIVVWVPPITSMRLFEQRHNILSNVRADIRKYVVSWLKHWRERNRPLPAPKFGCGLLFTKHWYTRHSVYVQPLIFTPLDGWSSAIVHNPWQQPRSRTSRRFNRSRFQARCLQTVIMTIQFVNISLFHSSRGFNATTRNSRGPTHLQGYAPG